MTLGPCFWPCIRTFVRTLFYQLFLTFTIAAITFIVMPEQVGFRSMTLYMSYMNHFHQVEFERALPLLKGMGQWRIWLINRSPKNFRVIEDAMAAEEWYWCKFEYENNKGDLVTDIQNVRIRWKTWEYYYELEPPMSEEDMIEYLNDGSLNSQETDRAFKLMRELEQMQQLRTEV